MLRKEQEIKVVVLILVLLFHTVCGIDVLKCPSRDALPMHYKSVQVGDFMIGGIASPIYVPSDQISFEALPNNLLDKMAV